MAKPKGWVKEPGRHGLAARGIRTDRPGSLAPSLHGMASRHRRMGSLRDEALLLARRMEEAGVGPITSIHLNSTISLLEKRVYDDALQTARLVLTDLKERKRMFPNEVRFEVQERTMRTRIIPAIKEAQRLKEV